MAASSGSSAQRPWGNSQGDAQGRSTRSQGTGMVEMLEYVKGLGIDPMAEPDMIWIAEEAFNAPLPPGWTGFQDHLGRVYFYDSSSGESTWRHPMDSIFREVVCYQRRVQSSGGFWEVEDELALLWELTRRDLQYWTELFDEHGEKFYHNTKSRESRFDDPREGAYHALDARAKAVARMMQRLPELAAAARPAGTLAAAARPAGLAAATGPAADAAPRAAPVDPARPEDPALDVTFADAAPPLVLGAVPEDYGHEDQLSAAIVIQSFCRVVLARDRAQRLRTEGVIHKGHQPLRGKLRLRVERCDLSGTLDVALGGTTPHKRHRAARKIQARVRGNQTRAMQRPRIEHRAFLSRHMTTIQAAARVWLARRRVARRRLARAADQAQEDSTVVAGPVEQQAVAAPPSGGAGQDDAGAESGSDEGKEHRDERSEKKRPSRPSSGRRDVPRDVPRGSLESERPSRPSSGTQKPTEPPAQAEAAGGPATAPEDGVPPEPPPASVGAPIVALVEAPDLARENSAQKIQSVFRGNTARKQVGDMKRQALSPLEGSEPAAAAAGQSLAPAGNKSGAAAARSPSEGQSSARAGKKPGAAAAGPPQATPRQRLSTRPGDSARKPSASSASSHSPTKPSDSARKPSVSSHSPSQPSDSARKSVAISASSHSPPKPKPAGAPQASGAPPAGGRKSVPARLQPASPSRATASRASASPAVGQARSRSKGPAAPQGSKAARASKAAAATPREAAPAPADPGPEPAVQVLVQESLESNGPGRPPSDAAVVVAASEPVAAPEQSAGLASLAEAAPAAELAAEAGPAAELAAEAAPAAELAAEAAPAAASEGDVAAEGVEPAAAESPAAAPEGDDVLPVAASEEAAESASRAPSEEAPETAPPVFEPAGAEAEITQVVASLDSGEAAEGGGGAAEAVGMNTLATEGGGDADAAPGGQHDVLPVGLATTEPEAVLPAEQPMESNASPGAEAAPMQHVALKTAPSAPPPAEGADDATEGCVAADGGESAAGPAAESPPPAAEGGGAAPAEAEEGGTEPSPEAPAEEEQAAAPEFEPTEADPAGPEAATEGAGGEAEAAEEGAVAAAEALPDQRADDPAALDAGAGAAADGQSAAAAKPQAPKPAQRAAKSPQKGTVRKTASKKPQRGTSRPQKVQAAEDPLEEVPAEPREQKPSAPPTPDGRAPQPPGGRGTVGEIAAGELRKASSGASLAGDETPQAAGGAEPLEDLSGLYRKTYGGVLVNGRFSKRHVAGVSQLQERERDAILEDIRLDKEARLRKIEERAKEKPRQTGTSREEKLKQFRAEAEAMEEERKSKKVEVLKEWLKKKEDQAREKKAREKEMVDSLIEQQRAGQEMALQAEQEHRKMRDSRLKWAEGRKEKLKAGLLAPMKAPQAAEATAADPSALALDIKKSSSLPQLQRPAPASKKPQLSLAQSQKVIHRHIHHHVHYHEEGEIDGADGEPSGDAYPSEEERRQIETASEGRVKAQLDASAKEFAGGGGGGQDGISKPGSPFSLPAVAGTGAARRRGLAKFANGLEAAVGTYADIRRPNFGAAW